MPNASPRPSHALPRKRLTVNPAPRRVGRPPKAATLLRGLLSRGKPSRFKVLRLVASLAEQAEQAAAEGQAAAVFLRDLAAAGSKAERLAARYARKGWTRGNR